MASQTKITRTKRKQTLRKAGRTRKNKMSKRSTVSAKELFEGCGEVEKPQK